MKAAIYARYSSDQQRDASIEDQVRVCRERLDREGWQLVQTYADRAISGSTMLRPGLQALLEDAMAARFDVIVSESLDRISRDQADVAGIYKRLQFAGIPLITVSEGEISDLHVGLKGTMNALYLKDLAEKTRRGMRGRVEAGRAGGGNCFGYDIVRQPDANGDSERGLRRINETEAAIVRRIFTEFAAGRSPRGIAMDLNADGVAGPSGVAWGPSTINGNGSRGTGILNNELYIGKLVWNRLRYIKDPDTGKRVSRPNPESAWIIQEVPDLTIVPAELWQAVNDRQLLVKKGTRPDCQEDKPFWEKTRPKYLLSGLLTCGQCGASFVKMSANHFGCAAARNKGAAVCDNLLTIRRDHLETMILEGLQHRLMEPDLFKHFVEEFICELNRLQSEQVAESRAVQTELARLPEQIDKLVMAIANGADWRPLNGKMKALEDRREELEARLASLPKEKAPLLHPNLADLYRSKVASLREVLDHGTERERAFELIRSLIEEVRLVPTDGTLRVELRGELAGILELCGNGNKKPGTISGTGLIEQIKLVAGARCNLYRTMPIRLTHTPTRDRVCS
ncbi:MAG: recombinase family protein, partial [Rhodospirillaceae bacterium]